MVEDILNVMKKNDRKVLIKLDNRRMHIGIKMLSFETGNADEESKFSAVWSKEW